MAPPLWVDEIAAARCFHTEELIGLLSPDTTPLSISDNPPSGPPPSGSVFLYRRRVTRDYKRDHHDWVKKPVSAKKGTSRVREDDVRLRHGGEVRVAGYYARSAAGGKTLRRRAYCLVDPVSLKPESDLVLVHYLDLEENQTPNRRKGGVRRGLAVDSSPSGEEGTIRGDRTLSSRGILSDESSVDGGKAATCGRQRQNTHEHECHLERGREDSAGNKAHGKTETKQAVDSTTCRAVVNATKSSMGGGVDNKSVSPVNVVSDVDAVDMICDAGAGAEDDGSVFERVSGLMSSSPISKMLLNLSQFQTAPKIVEEEFVKEWETCTEKEKSDAIEDIYGNALTIETPPTGSQLGVSGNTRNEFIHELQREIQSRNLSLLDEEIEKLSPNEKMCYLEAQQQHCQHLFSKVDFKLQMLRCENFDLRAAARRCANYWTKRVDHFGRDRAFLPLTLAGAMAGNCEEPEFHHARLLPGTDASGRGVIFIDSTIQGTNERCETRLRSIWYAAHAALEIESVRRKGIVFLVFKCPPLTRLDRQFIGESMCLMRETFPLQLRATHVCHFDQDGWYMPMLHAVLRYMSGKFMRSRLVFHEGSTEQVLLQLAEFGIARDQLPSRIGGDVSDEHFHQLLALRRESGK